MTLRLIGWWFCGALFLWASAAENTPTIMELLDDERALQVGDRLIYQVIEEREEAIVVFVNDRGEIDLPLIGRAVAAGKTCRTVAREIQALLLVDFFHQATVQLRYQYAANTRGRVSIAGAVVRQGPLPIPVDEVLTLSGAILRAGGLLPSADAGKITLIRKNPAQEGGESRQVVDLAKVFQEGRFELDVNVEPDDLIVVPQVEATGGQIYVLGAVRNPGLLSLPGNVQYTVSKAILLAGGFTQFAKTREVKLIRGDPTLASGDKTQLVDVDAVMVRGDRSADPVVKPNDIIRVEEKLVSF